MIDLRKFKVKKNSLVTPFDYLLISGNKIIQNATRLDFVFNLKIMECARKRIDIKIIKQDKVFFINSYIHNTKNALTLTPYNYNGKFKDKFYKFWSNHFVDIRYDKDFYSKYIFLDNGDIIRADTLQEVYSSQQYKVVKWHDIRLCYQKV